MTPEYRATTLENARHEYQAARERWNTAKTRKAKRDADEDLEFWGNKVAFLIHACEDKDHTCHPA
jgi:hypothetical protein